jgi:hypothetical protein
MLRMLMPATSTGVTGYLGGSVLESAVLTYPDLHITGLLRSTSARSPSRYPYACIMQGDFDVFALIEQASAAAGIMLGESLNTHSSTEHTCSTNSCEYTGLGDSTHLGRTEAILSSLSK